MLFLFSQLMNKTILLNRNVNIYRVSDINAIGDKSKPALVLSKGKTFVLDSYLLPTTGYTNAYGLTYAPRTDSYFTFYLNGIYYGVKVLNDGRFSVDALKEQGALTVKEVEDLKKKEAAAGTVGGFLNNIGSGLGEIFGKLKPVLIIILVIILVIYLLPVITKATEKK